MNVFIFLEAKRLAQRVKSRGDTEETARIRAIRA